MSNKVPTKRWLTIPDLCAYLSISKETVYRLIYSDKIPYSRVGKLYRFDVDKIDKAMAKGEINGN